MDGNKKEALFCILFLIGVFGGIPLVLYLESKSDALGFSAIGVILIGLIFWGVDKISKK